MLIANLHLPATLPFFLQMSQSTTQGAAKTKTNLKTTLD